MDPDLPTTVLLPPFGVAAPLDIEGEAGTPVLASQYRALAEIPAWGPALLGRLEAAMFRFYQDFADPAYGDPVIERAADVWQHVRPQSVALPDYENGAHTYVRVNLFCDWEPEHGVEWVIRDARDVLYVGPGSGTWPGWLEKGSRDGGFASAPGS